MNALKKTLLLAAAATLIVTGAASATPISFVRLTNNGNPDVASQLTADVTADGDRVKFKFTNAVVIASSITDIYFDNDPYGPLAGIFGITDSGVGVAFGVGATPPNLPGGNNANPAFSASFSADSDPAVAPNGVNASNEWVTITFNLKALKTPDDTLAALNNGDLRIGLKVQAIGTPGGSDSYLSKVQVSDGGTTLMLLGSALAGLGALRRRFGA